MKIASLTPRYTTMMQTAMTWKAERRTGLRRKVSSHVVYCVSYGYEWIFSTRVSTSHVTEEVTYQRIGASTWLQSHIFSPSNNKVATPIHHHHHPNAISPRKAQRQSITPARRPRPSTSSPRATAWCARRPTAGRCWRARRAWAASGRSATGSEA
jgi:hypothetical protein